MECTDQSGIESPEPRLVKGRPVDMPEREFINGAPEIGEAAAPPPTAQASFPQASFPIDGSLPEPVSSGPGSASNGTEGVSEIGAEIAVTEIQGGPAKRDIALPAQADLLGTGNTPGPLGTPDPQPQPGESRHTLHLSLSHNNAQPMEKPRDDGQVADMADASAVRPAGDQQQGLTQHPARHHPAPNTAAHNGGVARSMAEPHKGRDGGTFIDRALRERVDGDISAFLAAFDAALAGDTMESRAGLREATDRLLRAGARTRIELERLEARVPLSARDTTGYSASSWRPR
jgi:hypothetical protein